MQKHNQEFFSGALTHSVKILGDNDGFEAKQKIFESRKNGNFFRSSNKTKRILFSRNDESMLSRECIAFFQCRHFDFTTRHSFRILLNESILQITKKVPRVFELPCANTPHQTQTNNHANHQGTHVRKNP